MTPECGNGAFGNEVDAVTISKARAIVPGEVVLATPWFRIETIPPGSAAVDSAYPYYQIVQAEASMLAVLTEEGEFILIEQFRPPLNKWTIEFPSGYIDENEDPRAAAERELREETGFVCAALASVGVGRTYMNRDTGGRHMFFGVGARRDPHWQPQEDIRIRLVARSAFRELIASGAFEEFAAAGLIYMAEVRLGFRFFDDPLGVIVERVTAQALHHAHNGHYG